MKPETEVTQWAHLHVVYLPRKNKVIYMCEVSPHVTLTV
jgi:hypothetical protein